MKSILFLILSFAAFYSYAQDKYVCNNGNTQRIVEVIYSHPSSKLPCKVQYTKHGSHKILWRANNLAGYCESKAKEFTKKLTGWGWTCSAATKVKTDKANKADKTDKADNHKKKPSHTK